MVSLHLSLRAPKLSRTKKPKYDWQALKLSTELQDQYTIEVRFRFQALQNEDESPTDRYEKFIEANNSAMAKLLPVQQKGRRAQKAKHSDVIAAPEKLQKASNHFNNNPTEENRIGRNSSKESLFAVYDRLKGEHLAEKLFDAKRANLKETQSRSGKTVGTITSASCWVKRQTSRMRLKKFKQYC